MITRAPQTDASANDGRVLPADLSQIRVLVVDDHPAVRLGLRRLLEAEPDFVLVDVVETAEAGLSVAERERIDVAVVDYHLGARDGLWVSRKLKRLSHPARVVIYSAYADGPLAVACVVAEADALVSKGGVGSELCHAIRSVARGLRLLPKVPPPLAAMLRDALDHPDQAIFGMLLAGIEPAEIAGTLGISRADLESRQWALQRKIAALPKFTSKNHGPRARIDSKRLIARRNLA
jgi:DNA-binding NarL/FixJ family response regulator